MTLGRVSLTLTFSSLKSSFGKGFIKRYSNVLDGQGATITPQPEFWGLLRSLQPPQCPLGACGHLAGLWGVVKRRVGRCLCPGTLAGWLGPEITGASRKIISICLGPCKVGPLAPPPRRKRQRPHPGAPTGSPSSFPSGSAQILVVTTSTHPGSGGPGCWATGSAAGGLGPPRRGHPGKVWAVQSALQAIQAGSWWRPCWRQPRECVEMTPPGRRRSPLLTLAGKWSSSSGTINGDRSPSGAGQAALADGVGEVRRGRRRWGHLHRGQTTHRPSKENSGTEGGHTDTQFVQGNIAKGHCHHRGTLTTRELHHTTVCATSLDTTGSNKWFVWTHTIVSQIHIITESVTPSYHQFTLPQQALTPPQPTTLH